MTDSAENNPITEQVELIQATNAPVSEVKPPSEDDSELITEAGLNTKQAEQEKQTYEDETPTVHAKSGEDEVKPNDDPDNQTERVQTKTETEYETTEGGVKKMVKSSVTETKEFSHKVHRTVYNDSPDSTSATVSEFSDLPRARPKIPTRSSMDYKQKLPRTPVVSTVRANSPRSVFIERTIDASRASDARSRTMPTSASAAASISHNPPQSDEDTTRIIDGETYDILRESASHKQSLRNAKNISDVLSEELKSSRKQYEYMLTKTVHMESTIRQLHEKLKECKSRNKQLVREAQERESLIEKLHEAHNHVKRLQRYLEKVEDERTMLIKDYEILRQSHNRKEQQLQGYTTERAELLRRLDILEYDKQQLEYQLLDATRKDRSMKYHSGSYSSRKTQKYRKATQHISSSALHFTEGRSSSLPYGELPSSLQADLDHMVQSAPSVSATKPSGGEEQEETNKEPGWSVNVTDPTETMEVRVETGDDRTLMETPTVAENQVSPTGNADTITADPTSNPLAADNTQAEATHNTSTTHRSRTDGKVDDAADRNLSSPAHSPPLHSRHRHHVKPIHLSADRSGHHLSATDSPDDDNDAPYTQIPLRILDSYDSPRHTLPRSYYLKRRSVRPAGEFYTARSMDIRGESYSKSSRYKRPASAYGYVGSRYGPREYEIYPSPLPPRSTTSFGKIPTIERIRSPDREYSRIHRSPIRRPHVYAPLTPLSPDPFRYEPMRSSRAELNQLESHLDHLKREKRRLEKQFNATQTGISLTDSLRRREELLDRITRLAGEIRHVQLQLSRMY